MLNLEKHPYFEEYIDEKTKVKSFILKERVAELQQNFYFTEMGLTFDQKYLWFKCMNWPAEIYTLGVVSMDAENPFIRNFPGAGVNNGGQPMIIPGTHDVLFTVESACYRVDIEGNITKVFELDNEFLNYRVPQRVSTHLSFNSDNKLVILDIRVSDKVYLATYEWETGKINMIHKFKRQYNHAKFSPIDPNLLLIDQDWERDSITGERFDIDNRMWIMDIRGTRFEPILPNNWFRHNNSIICHDFWSADGKICWPDLRDKVYEHDLETRQTTEVWNHEICHAHTNYRDIWVGDDSPYKWTVKPCRIVFFDRRSGKEIDIFSSMPMHKYKSTASFHLDPHPCFTQDSKYITSMTTVKNGQVDLAITPVEPLIEICRKNGKQVNKPWKETL